MINKVILSGRITKDIEIKQTPGGATVTQFSLAVERNFAKLGEDRQTDFITCVAWNKTAEFIGKYFGKGRSIVVIGQL
jgi:single-strand DNA-binding protein